MSEENKQKTLGELLAEFRAENPEESSDRKAREDASADASSASTIAPIKAAPAEPEDDEEVNAEWLELISGMYI